MQMHNAQKASSQLNNSITHSILPKEKASNQN